MKHRIINFIKTHRVALGILLAAAFLRLYQVPERFVFDIDVQYQALLAWEQVKNFHVIWIGVSASNLGYYLGPGLVYFTAFLLKLSNGDPVILGYTASIIGIITAASMYGIVRHLFTEKTAFITLVLYSFSQFAITYDRRFWPIFIPLIAIWIYYSLVQSYKNPRWLVLSAFLIAASFHIHLSLLVFIPFFFVAVVQIRKRITRWLAMQMIGVYAIITSPLLVFDILHNFDNLLLPIRVFESQSAASTLDIMSSFTYLRDTTAQILLYDPEAPSTPLFLFASLILLLIMLARKWHNEGRENQYHVAILGVLFAGVLLYPGPLQLYYGVLFVPFVILAAARGLEAIRVRYAIVVLILYVILNTGAFLETDTSSGLAAKRAFIEAVHEQVGDRQYRLEFPGEKDFQGWRYLSQAYGQAPVSSITDNQFGWIYQSEISDEYEIIVLIQDDEPRDYNQQITKGKYTAYIIEK